MANKCYAIEADSIFELEDKINEFGESREIFSTQIFQDKKTYRYECLIWFKPTKPELIQDKEELATPSQIKALKIMGKFKEGISKKQAWKIISESKKGGKYD